jgi:hypothetical protein
MEPSRTRRARATRSGYRATRKSTLSSDMPQRSPRLILEHRPRQAAPWPEARHRVRRIQPEELVGASVWCAAAASTLLRSGLDRVVCGVESPGGRGAHHFLARRGHLSAVILSTAHEHAMRTDRGWGPLTSGLHPSLAGCRSVGGRSQLEDERQLVAAGASAELSAGIQ